MRSLVFDTDPGVDDALALLWLLSRPDADLQAITTVSGNVDVDLGTTNALALLALTGRSDIPVYRGASVPLEIEPIRATHVHGTAGLGEASLPPPEQTPAPGAAFEALCGMLQDQPGEIAIAAVGPLTNLALAERHAPGVLKLAREIYIMGGALHVPGNVSPTGEFNFVSDPLAVREVLHSGARLRLVSLDVTRQLLLSARDLEQALEKVPATVRTFCQQATATAIAVGRERNGTDGIYLHDPLTAMLCLEPNLADWEMAHLDLETHGHLTAGQLVVDERRQREKKGCRVEVAVGIEGDILKGRFTGGLRQVANAGGVDG